MTAAQMWALFNYSEVNQARRRTKQTEGAWARARKRLCVSFLALVYWNKCCQNCFSGWTAIDVESIVVVVIIRRDLITSAPKSSKSHCQKDPQRGKRVCGNEDWRWQWNAGVANDYSLYYKTCPAAPVNSCRQDNEKQKEHVNHHLCSGVSLNFFHFPLLCLFNACDANEVSQESGAHRPIQPLQLPCHVSKWKTRARLNWLTSRVAMCLS